MGATVTQRETIRSGCMRWTVLPCMNTVGSARRVCSNPPEVGDANWDACGGGRDRTADPSSPFHGGRCVAHRQMIVHVTPTRRAGCRVWEKGESCKEAVCIRSRCCGSDVRGEPGSGTACGTNVAHSCRILCQSLVHTWLSRTDTTWESHAVSVVRTRGLRTSCLGAAARAAIGGAQPHQPRPQRRP